jgi:hypothetical protein
VYKRQLLDEGGKLLSHFLDETRLSALGETFAHRLGLSRSSVSSLMRMATPLLLGMLAKARRSHSLDIGGLVDMLRGQKQQISRAIPDELARDLRGRGLFDDFLGDARAVGTAAHRAVDDAERAAKRSTPWLGWLIGALVVVALLLVLPRLLGGDGGPSERAVTSAVHDLKVGGIDLGDEVEGLFDDLGKSLRSIDDVASARAALPGLQASQNDLGSIERAARSLSRESQAHLGKMIDSSLATVGKTAETLLDDGAIGPVVKPALDDIMNRLSALTKI